MPSNYVEYHLQLVDTRTGLPIDDDTGQVLVLKVDSPVRETIYSDSSGTSKTQPGLLMTDGVIKFFTDVAVTKVDLSIMTAKGIALFLEDITPTATHRVNVDPDKREHVLVAQYEGTATTETDTGFDFPTNCLITDAAARAVTVVASATLEVGLLSTETGGDLDGFLDILPISTAGMPDPSAVVNNGVNIDFWDSSKYGVLLASLINGSDAVTTGGGFSKRKHRTDGTAKSLVTTRTSGTGAVEGYVYITYYRLP